MLGDIPESVRMAMGIAVLKQYWQSQIHIYSPWSALRRMRNEQKHFLPIGFNQRGIGFGVHT